MAQIRLTAARDADSIAGHFWNGLALNKKDGKRGPGYMELAVLGSVGTQLVVSVFIGFGIGYWLDKHLGTRPVLMLVFMLLGVASGFLNVYRTVARGTKSGNRQNNNR